MVQIKKIKEILSDEGIGSLLRRTLRKLALSILTYIYYLQLFFKKNILDLSPKFSIQQIINKDSLSNTEDFTPKLVLDNFIDHRFDLLGSGWIKVGYGMQCRGLNGYRYQSKVNPTIDQKGLWLDQILRKTHRRFSKDIWKLIDQDYIPIDWQIDFKSGYRWSEKTWFRNITHGEIKGTDIKVPWELARMQHLPLLAKNFVNKETSSKQKKILFNEFKNQILDFIATNPLGYGVNWSCSMDIAIRASNCLLAYDIFVSGGAKFDSDFIKHFTKSIFEHGLHISKNLEWNFGQRGNHFLSNLTGLIFISTYLGKSKITDKWLSFSIQQLIQEIDHQFNSDGTNFEGSTAYHRLSTELVVYSSFLILGLKKERLENLPRAHIGWPNKIMTISKSFMGLNHLKIKVGSKVTWTPFRETEIHKIKKMIEFLRNIAKPDGCFPQIGDNDNGRLFKLEPRFQIYKNSEVVHKFKNLENYSYYDSSDIYPLDDICNIKGFLGADAFIPNASSKMPISNFDHSFELNILNALLSENTNLLKFFLKPESKLGQSTKKYELPQAKFNKISSTDLTSWEYIHHSDLTQNLSIFCSQDFGLYIFKSDLLFLSLRGWSGKEIHGGHNHLDQLSIELYIEGKDIIQDPGTYNYTALKDQRWLYRSAGSHFSPFSDDLVTEKIKMDTFSSIAMTPLDKIYFDKHNFKAAFNYNGKCCYYEIKLSNNKILINSSKLDDKELGFSNDVRVALGYGMILN